MRNLILNKVQILLPQAKQDILEVLVDINIEQALVYCNLDEVPNKLSSTIVKMVLESYNKLGAEGLASQGFSGVSESFVEGYSADIISSLNRFKKIICL